MKTAISILTIVHQREEALNNVLAGLQQSLLIPGEIIVIHMNEEVGTYAACGFPIKAYRIDADDYLPLAEARNLAVEKAAFDQLVFLDVDCIPEPALIGKYARKLESGDALLTGAVRYLTKDAARRKDLFDKLDELSRPDSVRDLGSAIRYEIFWSLNFGCTKETFFRVGGFDPAFTGYGGEDTDFAFSARSKQVAIEWIDAVAYHQHHASYDPPLNHLSDIVKNANIFKKKWGTWPMGGWLEKFAREGYIRWNDHELTILNRPTQEQVRAALKS